MEHVNLIQYGETYEGRPLVISIVTHPNNTQSIEQIREQHLISSGLSKGEKPKKMAWPIVWLSYSVHGNESSSMEAALKTLYTFSDTKNKEKIKWLEKSFNN